MRSRSASPQPTRANSPAYWCKWRHRERRPASREAAPVRRSLSEGGKLTKAARTASAGRHHVQILQGGERKERQRFTRRREDAKKTMRLASRASRFRASRMIGVLGFSNSMGTGQVADKSSGLVVRGPGVGGEASGPGNAHSPRWESHTLCRHSVRYGHVTDFRVRRQNRLAVLRLARINSGPAPKPEFRARRHGQKARKV
jgi:hypothetical protein